MVICALEAAKSRRVSRAQIATYLQLDHQEVSLARSLNVSLGVLARPWASFRALGVKKWHLQQKTTALTFREVSLLRHIRSTSLIKKPPYKLLIVTENSFSRLRLCHPEAIRATS